MLIVFSNPIAETLWIKKVLRFDPEDCFIMPSPSPLYGPLLDGPIILLRIYRPIELHFSALWKEPIAMSKLSFLNVFFFRIFLYSFQRFSV